MNLTQQWNIASFVLSLISFHFTTQKDLSLHYQEGTFQWDSIEQGLVLGCYFYGYIVSNIPGAWLSRKFGFKVVIGIAHAVGSILTLLMPVASYASFELLVTMRVVLGLFQVMYATISCALRM